MNDRTRHWPMPRRSLSLAVAVALVLGVGLAVSSPGAPAGRSADRISLLDDNSTTTTPSGDGGATTSTSTTTPTTTVTTPPPAPASYADQLDALYAQLYAVGTALPSSVSTNSESTPSDFANQVASANNDNLGYIAQQLSPSEITSVTNALSAAQPVEQQVSSSLSVRATHSVAVTTHATSTQHTVMAKVVTTLVEPQSLTIIPDTLPTTDPYVDDSSNTYTASCPAGAPPINSSDIYGEGDLFAIQVAIDVVDGVYNGLSPGAGTDSPVGIGIYIAAAVLAAVGLALQVAEDTLGYFQNIANDCEEAQIQQVGIDTDNTAYQTYTLLANVAATANETDQAVANLTNQDTAQFQAQLTLDIEQALTAPVGTTPMSSFELPVSYEGLTLNGYLNSSPVGVDEVVATAITDMQETDQTMSPQATRDQTLADQALAAGQFKLSFDYFRLAYQAAAG